MAKLVVHDAADRVVHTEGAASGDDQVVVESSGLVRGQVGAASRSHLVVPEIVVCQQVGIQGLVRGRLAAGQPTLVVQQRAQFSQGRLRRALAARHVEAGRLRVALDASAELRVERVIADTAVDVQLRHVAIDAALLERHLMRRAVPECRAGATCARRVARATRDTAGAS